MLLKVIIAPLLGGIIGYITNDLAIKMLFHPRKAIYIGKFKLPFTPGLIPKQKNRIAASIGRVISNQLLNADTLRNTLLSSRMLEKMRTSIRTSIDSFADDGRSIGEVLSEYVAGEKLESGRDAVKRTATDFLAEKLLGADLGGVIVDEGIKSLKKSAPFLAPVLDEKMVKSIRSSVSSAVDSFIQNSGHSFLEKEVDKAEEKIMDMKLSELCAKNQHHIPAVVDRLVDFYSGVLEANMEKLLAYLNIEQIVVKKVSSFKAEELENMIFGIMKRELSAIVYLGAALGFLMGFVNLLF